MTGTVRKAQDKSVTVDIPDGRSVEFQLSQSTKIYREGKEVRAADLRPGDKVTVEATEDNEGYLHAKSVRVDQPAAPKPVAGSQPPPAEEADKTTPPDTVRVRPPDDGEWRPVLRRGPPPKRQGPEKPEDEEETAAPATQTSAERAAIAPPPAGDPFIAKARQVAADYARQLTSYVCREFMARFVSETRPVDWRPLDIVSADLVVENGHESYRNLAVNNRAVNKKSMDEVGGSWSTGEFLSILLDLFSPATDADFQFRRESTASGKRARLYDFAVTQPNSHWHVTVASQSMQPAYKGSIWIDAAAGHALRIEMQTRSLPSDFPLDKVETAVDYDTVRIGDRMALLPVHSENLSCQRGSPVCSKNVIDFRNYHKYDAESNITFTEQK